MLTLKRKKRVGSGLEDERELHFIGTILLLLLNASIKISNVNFKWRIVLLILF